MIDFNVVNVRRTYNTILLSILCSGFLRNNFSFTIQFYSSFLEEIDENLFNLSNKFALAHCVAEDLRMGAGIAIEFK